MPPVKRGLMRRKCWRGIQQYNPLLRKGGAVGRVYELQKKEGSHPLSDSTHCSPHQKEATQIWCWRFISKVAKTTNHR